MRYVRPFALAVLAASLPLLFFLTNGGNLAEIDPADGFKLLFVVTVTALAILFLCRPLVKDWERAGIVAGLGSYFAFNFIAFDNEYRDILPFMAAHNSFSVLLLLVLAVLLILGLRRLSDNRVRVTASYLLTVAAVLFLFKGYSVAAFAFGGSDSRLTLASTDIERAAPAKPVTSKPDVYYIVLDRYTGSEGLKAEFHFDNSRYLNALRKKGFYVAERSFGNYPGTIESLPSSLNASYFQAKPNPTKQGDATYYRKALVQRLQNPAVPRFFKRQGYEYVQIASWWGVTQRSKAANRIYRYGFRTIVAMGRAFHLTDAEDKFVERTILARVLKTNLHIGNFHVLGWRKAAARSRRKSASVFLRQVKDIEQLAAEKRGRPKFVFAHILMPHGPYVYDADGGPLPAGLTNNQRYLRQLQFTNREVEKLVDRLLKTYGKKPPVIMLVSDEGEHPADFKVAGPDSELLEKFNVSGAYYFPGVKHTGLYQTITPVNYFRVLMNDFFHTNLALLPDRSFFYVNRTGDITNRLRHPQLAKSSASTSPKKPAEKKASH